MSSLLCCVTVCVLWHNNQFRLICFFFKSNPGQVNVCLLAGATWRSAFTDLFPIQVAAEEGGGEANNLSVKVLKFQNL